MEQGGLFYLAARYQGDTESKQVYSHIQDIIHTTDCDLSAYRFMENTLEKPWVVVVLGEPPPEALHARFVAALQSGTKTELDEDIFTMLVLRRLEQIQKGPWVEQHTPVRLRRKQKNTKSRRDPRHRGRKK